jgi:hypothetical protein
VARAIETGTDHTWDYRIEADRVTAGDLTRYADQDGRVTAYQYNSAN